MPKTAAGLRSGLAAPNVVGRVEAWLSGRRGAVLLLLVTIAALIRLTYLVQVADAPVALQHRWDQSDMAFFDRWAGHVAGGDVLSRDVGHPFHRWHARIAEEYLDERPVLRLWLGALAEDGDPPDAAERELWSRWYGGQRFHQAPLYPYLMAVTRWIAGPEVQWVWFWQAVAGCVTVAVTLLIGWRLFGPAAGALAGALSVLYGPLVFSDALILRTCLVCLGSTALAWCAMSAARNEGWARWLAAGGLVGALTLLKPSFVVAFVGLAAVLILIGITRFRSAWRGVGGLTLGMVAVLGLAVVRNAAVGAPLFSVSSVGAITFVASNAADVPPTQGYFTRSEYAPEIMGKTGGRLAPTMRATVATHGSRPAYARFLLRKAARVLHWYEVPNNANFYFYRHQAPVLRFSPVGFGVVAPLGVVGLILGLSTIRRSWPTYVVLASVLVPLVLFYSLSRFRLPLAVLLLPFASLTVVRLASWIGERRTALVGTMIAILAVLGLWINRPLPSGQTLIRLSDYGVSAEVGVLPRARELAAAGKWLQAADTVGAFIELEPPGLTALGPEQAADSPEEAAVAHLFGDLRLRQAALLAEAGELDRALGVRQEAIRLHGVAAPVAPRSPAGDSPTR